MAKYNVWGIRYDDREFQVGDELPNSYDWCDCDCPEEERPELDGTCAILVSEEFGFLDYLDGNQPADCGELDMYKWAMEHNYGKKHIYLVAIEGHWGYEAGQDENEIIMTGAEVVRVIK